MNPVRCQNRIVYLLLGAALSLPGQTAAQLVPVKTVPVAAGDQFLLFPSAHLGMGGAGLALSDTLGDPFVNPATGVRLRESVFFGSPAFYHISDGNGSGRSLPLGTMFRSGDWFGGGAISLQEVEGAERNPWLWWPLSLSSAQPQPLSEGSSRNLYGFGMLGYRLPEHGISVGFSGFWADLNAMDGVDLLYANSREIQQSGHMSDLRLGALKEWEDGRALEILLLRSKLRMRHDVTYQDFVMEPILPDTIPVPQWQSRQEKNLDHTDTWGAHLAFRKPLAAQGWSIGWSLTGNWKSHPKIPNYEIQNIPRDPGDTRAYAIGLGLAKSSGQSRFAVDLILEPIRSETWAEAASDTLAVNGQPIPAGGKTVENDFQFINAVVKGGGSWDFRKATLRLGLQVRSVSYEMDQVRHLEALPKRHQEESWMEWTPSLGVSLNLPGLTLHYAAARTSGTGRPGTRWDDALQVPSFDSSIAFILAPSGPLTLQDATVTTHQLSVVVPIR